jgi:hypothetical protein
MSVANIPIKQRTDCSLIYLIDENLCVSTSLEVINQNFLSLSGALMELEIAAIPWNAAYTLFTTQSALWLVNSADLKQYSDYWIGTSTTIQTLSADWNKPFSILYPEIILWDQWKGINGYTSVQTQYLDDKFPTWLNTIIPTDSVSVNQKIILIYNLYKYQPFKWTFSRSYAEKCIPNGGKNELQCQQCPQPHRGCNHHGGRAGWGPCTNAYDHCTKVVPNVSVSYTCPSNGSKTLKLDYQMSSTDTSTVRAEHFVYQNINKKWVLIPEGNYQHA